MNGQRHRVFITGGSGYMGQRLIPRLLERGHEVRALVRPGSEKKLPPGCTPVFGNALDAAPHFFVVGCFSHHAWRSGSMPKRTISESTMTIPITAETDWVTGFSV